MKSTKPESINFLGLPSEIRNTIYRLLLSCRDIIHIKSHHSFQRQRTSGTLTRTKLATCLLYANRQIYEEASFILYSENTFCVTINELSHLGLHIINPQVDADHIIPAAWPYRTRRSVYRIRRLLVNIELRREYYFAGNVKVEVNDPRVAQEIKIEFAGVVRNALDELCMVLNMSEHLKEIDIHFVDRGSPALTRSDEHKVLEPLTCLRRLNRVECTGVPTKFADYLIRSMRQENIKGGISDVGGI